MQPTYQNIKVSNKYENSSSYNLLLSLSACMLCKHKEGVVIFGCIYKVFLKKYFIRVWFWINLIKNGRNKKKKNYLCFQKLYSAGKPFVDYRICVGQNTK